MLSETEYGSVLPAAPERETPRKRLQPVVVVDNREFNRKKKQRLSKISLAKDPGSNSSDSIPLVNYTTRSLVKAHADNMSSATESISVEESAAHSKETAEPIKDNERKELIPMDVDSSSFPMPCTQDKQPPCILNLNLVDQPEDKAKKTTSGDKCSSNQPAEPPVQQIAAATQSSSSIGRKPRGRKPKQPANPVEPVAKPSKHIVTKPIVHAVADPLLDHVCSQLPDPETLCSPDFEQHAVTASVYEPAHVLVPPRESHSMIQAKFEYTIEDFVTPEDPALWKHFQQKKYARWTELHPLCKQTTIKLVPQNTVCARTNKINQPQCRACIGRVGGKLCRFADVRYATEITIELENGTTALRYLICPVFRSQIEKSPAIRQSVTPIILPEDTVVDGDESWVEFHVLCQTVSSTKSLLRRELAVVRDVEVSELRGINNGAISFYSSGPMPQAVQDENGNSLHPLYGCAPSPCILRKVPFGAHQKCDFCSAPIFSTYFSCCLCMQEVCVECFTEWDDSDIVNRCYSFEKGAKGQGDGKRNTGLAYCKRYTVTENDKPTTYSTQHKKRQFVRVSHFSEGELEMMMRKVNRVVQYCDFLDETQPSGYSSISLCANALGRRGQQSRIDSSWVSEVLDSIDKDTAVIASLGDADFGADPSLRIGPGDIYKQPETLGAGPSNSQSHYLEAQWDAKLKQLYSASKYPQTEWQTQPVYVSADNLSLREFARLWEEGRVVVVTNLLTEELQRKWTPQALNDMLGKLPVHINELNSQRAHGDKWTMSQFLRLFTSADENAEDEHTKQLRTARFRTSIDLSNGIGDYQAELGTLRNLAAEMLPVTQYTRADGKLNLVNRLPAQYARPPDFGPKLHCVYGTRGAGSKENMRREVADMVSLLVYASDTNATLAPPEGNAARRRSQKIAQEPAIQEENYGAVEWDIYMPSVADHLRGYLGDEASTGRQDALCGQVHVSGEQMEEIYEVCGEEARSCRVWQNAGDAVFVPAGSIYQKRIFSNCISVESKFLSPEHTATARRVSSSITASKGHVQRKEALPVMDILWWTWMGFDAAQGQIAEEVIAAKRVPRKQAAPARRTPRKQAALAEQGAESSKRAASTPRKRGRPRK
ncbi:hypothetical protein IWW40_002998 [Coemansia sp. RSA 1250]|nr:hypothetical protein IWW40_002998 [Coemansia sp. RSA 1250]